MASLCSFSLLCSRNLRDLSSENMYAKVIAFVRGNEISSIGEGDGSEGRSGILRQVKCTEVRHNSWVDEKGHPICKSLDVYSCVKICFSSTWTTGYLVGRATMRFIQLSQTPNEKHQQAKFRFECVSR